MATSTLLTSHTAHLAMLCYGVEGVACAKVVGDYPNIERYEKKGAAELQTDTQHSIGEGK